MTDRDMDKAACQRGLCVRSGDLEREGMGRTEDNHDLGTERLVHHSD